MYIQCDPSKESNTEYMAKKYESQAKNPPKGRYEEWDEKSCPGPDGKHQHFPDVEYPETLNPCKRYKWLKKKAFPVAATKKLAHNLSNFLGGIMYNTQYVYPTLTDVMRQPGEVK